MQTVVGVFDTLDEAQRARTSLVGAGFDESAIQVQSQSAMMGGEAASTSTTHTSRDKDEGFMASIGHFFSNLFGGEDEGASHYAEAVRRGGTVVAVTVADESRVEAARAALAAAGAVDIEKRAEGWRQEGYAGFDPSARPFGAEEIQAERSRFQPPGGQPRVQDGAVLPVMREETDIGKKEVDLGAVRVFTRTETRPVSEQVELRETGETPVVSKTAQVVEDVTVGTQPMTRTETVSDQVRNTVVDVEKAGQGSATGMPADYRNHYLSNTAAMGGSYEDYEPAYRYGSTLRSDSRYADRAWDDVETDAQRDWTSHNPSGSWEKAKLAVKHGWESMTGQR